MNKKIVSVILAILMLCAIFISPAAAAEVSVPKITRLAGTTRYDTACEIAKGHEEALGKGEIDTIIIANGLNYADALAGVPLSDFMNAPILLTSNEGTLEPAVLAQMNEIGIRTAFILGGPYAVSEEISDQLKDMDMIVTRLAGESRYDTAVDIAQFNFDFLDVTRTAFLVSGENFPDALSAGAVAGITKANILFCPQSGEIKEPVAQLIKNNGINNIVIVGGPNAVGKRAERELAALGVNTERVYGTSRYATSLAVYEEYMNLFDPSVLTFATGANFPDALAGGALSATLKAPIILVDNGNDNTAITEAIKGVNIEKVIVYGGEYVVSGETVRKIFAVHNFSTTSSVTTTTTTTTAKPTATTTQKPTTTTQKPTTTTSTTTTTTTTTAKPTTTTTAAASGRWVSEPEMNRILGNVRDYSESIGMHWDTTLNENTAFWATDTSVNTNAYKTAADYESRVKNKISYFYNRNLGFEYVNVIVTSNGDGEYTMTCYFG